MDRLVEHARAGRLAVFAGAGLSVPAPTFLPSWGAVQSAVIDALTDGAERFVGARRIREMGEVLLARQRDEKLPPEYQAQILADRLGRTYFDVLYCLDSDVPNQGHLALAAMARAGTLRTILTTNFDRTIEAAFRQMATPLEVLSREAAFARLAQTIESEPAGDAPCRLLKLHGSSDDPDTLIDTLAQRKVGLPPSTSACVRHLLRRCHWLFLGWSGLDLAAERDYLCLRSDAHRAVGFTWLVREGERPRPEVDELVQHYGAHRAATVHGELPGWLGDLARATGVGVPPVAALPPDEVERRRREVADRVVDHARSWARNCDAEACALALSDLLRAAGRPDAAFDLLTNLKRRTAVDDPGGERNALVLAALGILHRERGEFAEAKRLFEDALPVFEQAGQARHRSKTLANLGLVDQGLGQHEEALRVFQGVAQDLERSGELRGVAEMLHNQGLSLFEMGRYEEALRAYDREIQLAGRCGDEVARAGALQSMAEVLLREDRLDDAGRVLADVLAIQVRLGDERGRAQALCVIGAARRRAGDRDGAVPPLHEALAIFERLGAREDAATAVSDLARVAFDRRDYAEALRLFRAELAIREGIGSELATAKVRMNIGCVHIVLGELDAAQPLIEAARELFERLDQRADLVAAEGNLKTIARRRQNM